jgi:hypothetical protein
VGGSGGDAPLPRGLCCDDAPRPPHAEPGVAEQRIAELEAALRRYELGWPPGHFYSPVPDFESVLADADRVFARPGALPGIDLRERHQFRMLSRLAPLAREAPFGTSPGLRYHYENPNFRHADALALFALLRYLRPRRIVEVGSGYSSCVTLDANERFLGWSAACTFIEPFPGLLHSLIRPDDRQRVRILEQPLQKVDRSIFRQLTRRDVLFVDSTHVSKIDSDVNHLLFEILPSLRPGVRVHFHDVFYPFEYPQVWIEQGRAWNECYLLRAFLQYNPRFRIELFNNWLQQTHPGLLESALPGASASWATSLWLKVG